MSKKIQSTQNRNIKLETGNGSPTLSRQLWNSLEMVKIAISLLTPLIVLLTGYILNAKISEKTANDTKNNIKTTITANMRLGIYNDIRDKINRIYCFVQDVGTWKDDNPKTIIQYKRSIDSSISTTQGLWTASTLAAFKKYEESAFKSMIGVGIDAQIRTDDGQKKFAVPDWNENHWNERITHEIDPTHKEKYNILIKSMFKDILLDSGTATTSVM